MEAIAIFKYSEQSPKKRLSSGWKQTKGYDHTKGMPFYHLKMVILVLSKDVSLIPPQAGAPFL